MLHAPHRPARVASAAAAPRSARRRAPRAAGCEPDVTPREHRMPLTFHDVERVLRPSRWVNDIQVIGALPEHVARQTGLGSGARSVWLHQESVANICEQRHLKPRDSEFVLEYMPAAVLRPMFHGLDRKGDASRIAVAGFVRPERRYLYLALKVVPSRGLGPDEDAIWVSTGYPLSEEAVRRHLRRGTLKPVVWGMEA